MNPKGFGNLWNYERKQKLALVLNAISVVAFLCVQTSSLAQHNDSPAPASTPTASPTAAQLDALRTQAFRQAQQELNNQLSRAKLEIDNNLEAGRREIEMAIDAREKCERQAEIAANEAKSQAARRSGEAMGQAAQGLAPTVGQAAQAVGQQGQQEKERAQKNIENLTTSSAPFRYVEGKDIGSGEFELPNLAQLNEYCKKNPKVWSFCMENGEANRQVAQRDLADLNNQLQRQQTNYANASNATTGLMQAGLTAAMQLLGPAMLLSQGNKEAKIAADNAEIEKADCIAAADRQKEQAERKLALTRAAGEQGLREITQQLANLTKENPSLAVEVDDPAAPGGGGGGPEKVAALAQPKGPEPASTPPPGGAGGGGGGGGGDPNLAWTFGNGQGGGAGGRLPDQPDGATFDGGGGGGGAYGYVDPSAMLAGLEAPSPGKGGGVGGLAGDGGLWTMINRARMRLANNSQYFVRAVAKPMARGPSKPDGEKKAERIPNSVTRY